MRAGEGCRGDLEDIGSGRDRPALRHGANGLQLLECEAAHKDVLNFFRTGLKTLHFSFVLGH